MNSELTHVIQQLKKAKCPEDVFGDLSGDKEKTGKKLYHQFAKVCHADKYTDPKDKKAADNAFVLLKKWWDQAEKKIADGTYGNRKVKVDASTPAPITIQSKTRVYAVTSLLAAGDIADVWQAEFATKTSSSKALVKVVRHPKNNDLMTAERAALDALAKVDQAKHRVPVVLESLTIQDSSGVKRSANVFDVPKDDLVPLSTILDAFHPNGLDPRHVAWMGSRLWTNLGITHAAGFVHGSIHPDHCLICPENHGMVLVDWCYSVKIGTPVKAISPKWRAFYPREVFDKKPATQATDIYMGAFTLAVALGAVTNDPHNPVFDGTFDRGVPIEMQRFLRSCLLPAQHRRPQDAIEIADDWKKMLQSVFGKPKFLPFSIPAKVGAA
jgi:hypothetical protein